MSRRVVLSVVYGLLILAITLRSRADVVADCEDLALGASTYWNGSDLSGGFRSEAVVFRNTYDTTWGSWAGFACSRVNDQVTPGFGNQYAVISGTGVGGAGNYAVVYDDGLWGDSDVITLPVPCAIKGFYINNTTYAALSMRDGDGFAKKFGGASGTDPDWFMLTITAQDEYGEETGATNTYLADYRFGDPAQDYIVTNWTWVSLINLGSNVKTLRFTLSSSDNSYGYMNTPAYFAMDNLTTLESYAHAAGQAGSTAIDMSTNALIAWATGWTNYVAGVNCDLSWQTPGLATGVAVGTSFDVVCLGDGGQITMTFDTPIQDGPGNDLAVFENSFDGAFLELAYVEVSSDGTNFTRFFNRSLTTNPVSAYGEIDPQAVSGLGCKYQQGYGEPFDLGTLRGVAGLDVGGIRYVRLLDISGHGSCTDSVGHVIHDPYLSTGSAGFDLDAVGVLSNDFQEVLVEAACSPASREGPSNGTFRLRRKTWNVSADLDVVISLSGSASNGTDYARVTNTVRIPAGVTTQDVVIAPFVDVASEGDQTVILHIVTNDLYQVENRGGRASMTIRDIPRVSITAVSTDASEIGDAAGVVVVARNTVRSDNPLTVGLVMTGSADVSDYTGLISFVVFPPGVLSTTLYVFAEADADIEGDETLGVHVAPDTSYRSGGSTQATLTIRDLPIDAWRASAASPAFENLPFVSADYWNGSDSSGGFAVNGIHFKNAFTDWGGGATSWAGFSYSRVNDPVTAGYGNQYAVISGSGVGGTGAYIVAYDDGVWSESDIITLPAPARVLGFYINNSTYAALSMRDGDGYSRKFCAESNDWFKVTITGCDASDLTVGSLDFYLADYRFSDPSQNYIVTNWTWVSLTNLGANVKSLHFALGSSDNGEYGMNTPAYFALDDLRVDATSPAFDDTGSWCGNGTANLLSYVLGRDGGVADEPELITTNDASFFAVTYSRLAYMPDAGVSVEACTNLCGGASWTTNGITESVIGVDSGIETVSARIPHSDTNLSGFARLRAWRK